MPTTYISGPYLQHYPAILNELKRLHISLSTVRYVEVITQEIVFRHSNREPFGSMRFNPQATAILHTGESVKLTLTQLEKSAPRLHNGHIGDGKTVRYKKKVWNEDIETYMPGIRLSSRTLTVHQALELLEWLEQERPVLEQKVQEEQSAPLQG